MKHLSLLIACMVVVFSFAQNQKYTYKLTVNKSDKESAKAVEEQVSLVVSKEGSAFYNEDKIRADSTITASVQKAKGTGNFNLDFRGVKMGTFSTTVFKNYPSYDITVMDRLGSNLFEYEEKRKPEWKILPEKQKIGEWQCQKATASFLGREWTAWFTTDIPVQDGPYVFHGLPGLIVKISDIKNDYTFELEGVKNKFSIAEIKKNKLIKINYDKFKKEFQDNYLDPGKAMRLINAESVSGMKASVRMFENGKEVDIKEIERRDNEAAKTRKLTDLNPIDLDLIKQ